MKALLIWCAIVMFDIGGSWWLMWHAYQQIGSLLE